MIITITGKPCSGKGTVAKAFCKKYNFEYVCTGDMFRQFAKQFGYDNILTFQQQDPRVTEIDKLVDNKTKELSKQIDQNIVVDSRMAWHFIPNSFKVFIDVNDSVAGQRLLDANRETEQSSSLNDAIKSLQSRWLVENERYTKLYNTNNLSLNNYDFVIDSSNLTPEEIVEKIYEQYKLYKKNKKH